MSKPHNAPTSLRAWLYSKLGRRLEPTMARDPAREQRRAEVAAKIDRGEPLADGELYDWID